MADGGAGTGVGGLVAVVSGAGRGIGHAITEALLDGGCRVAALDVAFPAGRVQDADRLDIVCDITDEGQVSAAVAEVEARFGSVDVVVNNAAVIEVASTEDTSLEVWKRIQDVNVTGAFILTRRCIPAMKAAGSAASSTSARTPGRWAARATSSRTRRPRRRCTTSRTPGRPSSARTESRPTRSPPA